MAFCWLPSKLPFLCKHSHQPSLSRPFLKVSVPILLARNSLCLERSFPTVDSVGSDLGWRIDIKRHFLQGPCIGSGSFGSVYKGRHLHTGEEVAIKVIPKLRANLTKEKCLAKIDREVDILRTLHSSYGVIQFIASFEDETSVYLVTEYCSGGDLQKVQYAFPENSLAIVALEVLKILRCCHERGVVHGDVKPANFVFKSKDNPLMSKGRSPHASQWLRAIDFGCSQRLRRSRFSKRKGTPVYMAPEVFQRDYGTEADIWSLGVMLYQLFARRLPFWESNTVWKWCKFEEIESAVLLSDITFDYGPWVHMSEEGLDFLSGCLQRNYKNRLTVSDALQHKWITSMALPASMLSRGSSIVAGTPTLHEAIFAPAKSLVKSYPL